jgi:hypothetical protein
LLYTSERFFLPAIIQIILGSGNIVHPIITLSYVKQEKYPIFKILEAKRVGIVVL